MPQPFITRKVARNGSSRIRVCVGALAHFCNIGGHGAIDLASARMADRLEEGGLRVSVCRTVAVASGGTMRDMRAVRRFAIALTLLVPGACATYTPAPIDPARTAEAFAARRLDAPELRDAVARALPEAAEPWPPGAWDRAGLLAVALADNGSLAIARAELGAALAAEVTAGERPNPTLGLQSEYARHEPDHWLYGVSFDFLLPHRAVRAIDIELAETATAGARAGLMEKTWTVRRALVAALSDRESARRRLDAARRLAGAQDRLIGLQQRRVDAGEDAPTDLNASQTARLDTEQQVASARADVVAGDAAVAAALGVPAAALDGIPIAWPDWGSPPAFAADGFSSAREAALLSRADLASAIDAYAGSEKRLERAIARQYPQFELKPGYYWDHGIAKWPFEVDFALPFNRNQGEIAEAKAGREVAGQKLLALQADIFGAVDAALRADGVAAESLDAARRRAESLEQQLAHADVALGLGAGDNIERTNAEVLVLRAELEAVQAAAQRQAARNALEDALHAPLSGPELALAKAWTVAADSGVAR
jgi:outer membrane protein TolC